jgi:hypothetical protein
VTSTFEKDVEASSTLPPIVKSSGVPDLAAFSRFASSPTDCNPRTVVTMDWHPNDNERLLYCAAVHFATGMAPNVSGCRWFRDADRNDIQDELPNWPAGPTFTPNSATNRAAQRIGRAFLVGVPLIIDIAANALGSPGSIFGSDPVMWAAPGTVARTVPWQLDPARRTKGYTTDIVFTDRRLLFVGTPPGEREESKILWSISRNVVAKAKKMSYSEVSNDLRITFTDQSWIRLFTGSSGIAELFSHLVNGKVKGLCEDDLTQSQRSRVDRYMAHLPKIRESLHTRRIRLA